MINKSELRKGNIVSLSRQIVTIKEVFEETVLTQLITGEEIFFSLMSIYPIQLTGNLLMNKLGFQEWSKNSDMYVNSLFVLDYGEGRFHSIPGDGPFYYVHQLQNLYLKFNNSELVVNNLFESTQKL